MKLYLLIGILMISQFVFGQKEESSLTILEYVDSIVSEHVTFISWHVEKDTIKVTQIRIYDYMKKNYIDFYEKDIIKNYPKLRFGFTLKTALPFSASYRCNINDFYYVNPINLFDGSNINLCSHTNIRIQISPRKFIT